jgi:hypothetical protein
VSTYEISTHALHQARALGLGLARDELTTLLIEFAEKAAIVTHPKGTRRFGGYVLDMDDTKVYGIAQLEAGVWVCPDCHGTQQHRMLDGVRWIDVNCQTCATVQP